MRTVHESTIVEVAPAAAQALWVDTSRWPSFVDGFARLIEGGDTWPEAGAKLVWQSGPAGRGRVTERVRESGPGVFATDVFEDQLAGMQTVLFDAHEEGSLVTLQLEYELQKGGPLRAITDALFIRRAVSDALVRTLRRFSTEAAEQATL